MFTEGFTKVAYTASQISPEKVYDLKAEKNPWKGAVLGSIAGAAAGAAKKKTHKAALIGAGVGGAAGASTAYLAGKANKAIRLGLLNSEIKEMNLKTTPNRRREHKG